MVSSSALVIVLLCKLYCALVVSLICISHALKSKVLLKCKDAIRGMFRDNTRNSQQQLPTRTSPVSHTFPTVPSQGARATCCDSDCGRAEGLS